MTTVDGNARTARRAETSGAGWDVVLRWAAFAAILDVLGIAVLVERSFTPAVIVGALFVIGLALLAAGRRPGVWVLTIASGLTVVATLLGLPQLTAPASFGSFVTNWLAAITGGIGLTAGVITWGTPKGAAPTTPPSARARRLVVAAAALAVVVVVVGAAASLGFSNARPAAGDVVVRARLSAFHPPRIEVPTGKVSFFLANDDNTLHDFRVVGVRDADKDLPANHRVRLTVTLAAGTYRYECDLHSGMTGTITVR